MIVNLCFHNNPVSPHHLTCIQEGRRHEGMWKTGSRICGTDSVSETPVTIQDLMKQDLSLDRVARPSVPCPSHKKH